MEIDEIISNLREFGSSYIYESSVGKNILFVIKQSMGLFLVIDFGTMIGILGIYFSIFAPFYFNFLDIFKIGIYEIFLNSQIEHTFSK
ncbi:hypothetical protein QIA17_04820 (plasmid) [Borreliella californiensis]|uniref:Putative membrane protein n=1 Tax=Borreliella californiensis TaxID=373543 RepID=A0A7W9ZLU1_9SPIR|nr:hypothetical protein [Borreliella californiensis]MBB6213923.1 putative membrane protein [Borreliella californiensis]